MKKEVLKRVQKRNRLYFTSKLALIALTIDLLAISVVGGSLAWLSSESAPVVNTFTTSNIKVTLTENQNKFQMIPGYTIDKDPVVTLKEGSEACYVFLEVKESSHTYQVDGITYDFDDYIAYQLHTDWKRLKDENNSVIDNVYYQVVDQKAATDITFDILVAGTHDGYTWNDNQVLTKPEVTQDMMDAVNAAVGTNADNAPSLSFKAYAFQLHRNHNDKFDAKDAWDLLNPQP